MKKKKTVRLTVAQERDIGIKMALSHLEHIKKCLEKFTETRNLALVDEASKYANFLNSLLVWYAPKVMNSWMIK